MTALGVRWLTWFSLVLCTLIIITPAQADIGLPDPERPTVVQVDLKLEDINDIDLGTGTFDLTAQFGMSWRDARLAYESDSVQGLPRLWMGKRAEQQLQHIWHPIVDVSGERGLSTTRVYSLAIWPDGQVDLRKKFTASPRFDGELTYFPFGHLGLNLALVSAAMDSHQVQFELGQLSPNEDLKAVDAVIHGNWIPEDVSWSVSERSRSSLSDRLFAQIDVNIQAKHDFLDGVHKILLPLLVIFLASWGLLWLDPTYHPAFSSPRIGGTTTLILTTIALKFVLNQELPVVHYFTLSDVLFNVTIIMLSVSLLVSCHITRLFVEYGPDRARPVNRFIRRYYPVIYISLLAGAVPLLVA